MIIRRGLEAWVFKDCSGGRVRRDDGDKSACGYRERRLHELGLGSKSCESCQEAGSTRPGNGLRSNHVQGWAEVGAVEGKERAGSPGFLCLWPEHFTNMENSRILHEPLHSISL